jgi:hypothetical protein
MKRSAEAVAEERCLCAKNSNFALFFFPPQEPGRWVVGEIFIILLPLSSSTWQSLRSLPSKGHSTHSRKNKAEKAKRTTSPAKKKREKEKKRTSSHENPLLFLF